MPRKKKSHSSSIQAHGNGRLYRPFPCGEFLKLVKDPGKCYIVGNSFPKGQVIETLALEQWFNGTRFETQVEGLTVLYEVNGREMHQIKGPVA